MPSRQSQSLHLTWHIHLGGECILQSLFALTVQMTLLSNCRLMIDNVTELYSEQDIVDDHGNAERQICHA